MSELNPPPRTGHPAASGPAARQARCVAARGQRLVDTPRPIGGHSDQWHIEAFLVGDLTALVAAALRERRPG